MILRCLVLSLILIGKFLNNSSGQTPNSWTQENNFSGGTRSLAVGFNIGSKIYIGTGTNGASNPCNDFWQYDTTTNVWSQKANFGGGNRTGAVGFSIGSKGYIGTGSGSTEYNDFWEYDPLTNLWTQKASFGGSARDGAVGFSIGNNGYIGTGQHNSSFYNDFWKYKPSDNSWTQMANFAGSARYWAVGFSIGGTGYLGTGSDGTSLYNDFWAYDTVSNIWTQKINFGGIPRQCAIGFSIGNNGYIGTGVNLGVSYNDFWEYTPACVAPIPPVNTTPSSNQNICSGQSTILSANGPGAISWFNAATGGAYLGSGTNFTTPILTSNTTYYVQDSTCAVSPTRTSIPVIVKPLPLVTNSPLSQTICSGSNTALVTLTSNISGTTFSWTATATTGVTGFITSGTSTIPIQTISTSETTQGTVTYAIIPTAAGCSGPVTNYIILVNPLPNPTISGLTSVCINSGYYSYSTETGMLNYSWNISSGGLINSGSGTNQISVSWIGMGSQTVSVTYTNQAGCNASAPTVLNVTVSSLPDPAGLITGLADVCKVTSGVVYSVAVISNATGYIWTVPTGVVITSGTNTDSITVNFTQSAISGNIAVQGTNSCGTGTISPDFYVTVNPIPQIPIVTNSGDTLQSSFPTGNQWYFEGNIIPAATSQDYIATQEGYYWDVRTLNGCSSDTSNHKLIILTGINLNFGFGIEIYPIPNQGQFNILINTQREETFGLSIFNNLGILIYQVNRLNVSRQQDILINLGVIPSGLYTVCITNYYKCITKKLIIYSN